jgi:hypothetical protein
MMRFHLWALLALAAACGPGRPTPPPQQWIVLREDAEQRARLDVLSIRMESDDIRRAAVAVDYASVQEKDDLRYDREEIYLRFDCRRGAMRREEGGHYLGDDIFDLWVAAPEPLSIDGAIREGWDKVPPGTYLDDAMKHVCRTTP